MVQKVAGFESPLGRPLAGKISLSDRQTDNNFIHSKYMSTQCQ